MTPPNPKPPVFDEPVYAQFHQRGDDWFYFDENYPDDGLVGPFTTELETRKHAWEAGYTFEVKEG